MISQRSTILSALVITAICFVFTYLFFGFYFSEYEGLNIAFFSGKLTPEFPFRSLYFSGNMGISYFYSYLYEHFPNVEWLSWIEYGYLFIACSIGMYILLSLLPPFMPRWLKWAALFTLYFLVFADHNVHLLYTRVSYMICGFSLLGIIFIFRSEISIKENYTKLILLYSFFTVGTFTRIEAAVACFLLLSFFALLYIKDLRKTVILLMYPAVIVLSLSVYLMLDIGTAGQYEFYKQVEPDIEEQIIARGNRVPISDMKTHRDSVIYEAAVDMMWSDPHTTSPDYLRSLIKPEAFIFTDANQWTRVWITIIEIFSKFWHLVMICVILSIVLLMHAFKGKAFEKVLLLAFVSSFWVLTVMQTYTDKINERSFLPLMSIFILCNIILIIDHLKNNMRVFYYLSLLVVLFTGYHTYVLKKESTYLHAGVTKYQAYLQQIKNEAIGKYLVVNSTTFDYLFLSNEPFVPYDFSAFKKVYITDGYIIPFLPYYKRYLESECKCNIYDFPSFWKYILALPSNDVVVISQSRRFEITRNYLAEIHSLLLPIKEEKVIEAKGVDVLVDDTNILKKYLLE